MKSDFNMSTSTWPELLMRSFVFCRSRRASPITLTAQLHPQWWLNDEWNIFASIGLIYQAWLPSGGIFKLLRLLCHHPTGHRKPERYTLWQQHFSPITIGDKIELVCEILTMSLQHFCRLLWTTKSSPGICSSASVRDKWISHFKKLIIKFSDSNI